MGLQIEASRLKVSKKSVAAFFAVLALFVQPFATINLPSAFAAGDQVVINSESATLTNSNDEYAKTVDTSGLENISLSFDYNGSTLDTNEGTVSLNYSAGSASGQRDIIGVNGTEATAGDSGNVTLNAVPSQTGLEVIISADTSGFANSDQISLTNITLSGTAVVQAPAVPATPILTVTPASCENPVNVGHLTGDATDFRWEYPGSIRLQGEYIPQGVDFDVVQALEDFNVPVNYGVNNGQLVWYDRQGTKQDIFVQSTSFTLVNPADLNCSPSPTTTIVAPTGVVGGTFTVSGEAHDDKSLNRVYVQLVNRQNSQRYGGTTINLIGEGKDAQWSKTYDAASLNLPDGKYAAHVSVVDMDGDTGSAGWTENFTVDTTAPDTSKLRINGETISGSYKHTDNCSPINELYQVKGDINLTAVIDDTNGVESASYKVKKLNDGGCTVTNEYSSQKINLIKSNKNASNWNQNGAFDSKAEELNGKYAIVLVAQDGAGNKTTKYIHLDIDNKAPQFENATFEFTDGNDTVSADVTDNAYLRGNGTFTVNFTESNPLRTYVEVQVKNENGKWQKIAGSWSTGDAANSATLDFDTTTRDETKEYQLKISSDDTLSNHAGKSILFSIDNTKPSSFEITSPANGTQVEGDFTVNGVAEDAKSGIEQVRYKVRVLDENGDPAPGAAVIPFTDAVYNDEDKTWSFDVSDLEDGFYRIAVQGIDKAGNYKARSVDVEVKNPVVTDPGDGEEGEGPTSPNDTDGDGVPNDVDDCPSTPANTLVNGQGCELIITDEGGQSNELDIETKQLSLISDTPSGSNSTPLFGAVPTTNPTQTNEEDADDDGDVLGTSRNNTTPLEQTAVIAKSGEGWKLWGVAWYWYLLILAILGAVWWFLIGRRRNSEA